MVFLNFIAPNKEPVRSPCNEPGPLGKLIDLGRLAKGRILVSVIKKGMTRDEVLKILGPPGMILGGFSCYNFYEEYGITVDYSLIGPFDSNKKPDPPKVISAEFQVASECNWKNIWRTILESRVDALLRGWDKANQNIRAAHYMAEWTTEDIVLKHKEIRKVEGFVQRPSLARIHLKDDKGKPRVIFLYNEKLLEIYNFQKTEKIAWNMPVGFPEEYLNMGWLWDILARPFYFERKMLCFDFSIGEIYHHFAVRLNKEDKYWAYIQLMPKSKESQTVLRELEVVLDQRTHLVRQYRLLDSLGNRSIFDLQKVEFNPTLPITWESISKDLPKGFKEVSIPTHLNGNISESTDPESRQP
jgi:outer membrane lipoprotein-sorting protein